MKSFTKYLFFYLVIALVGTSCSSNDSPNPILVDKTCKLVREVFLSSSEKMTTDYKYNSDNKISEMKISYNNGETETTTFIYNLAGKLTNRKITTSTRIIYFTMFYRTNGQLEKCSRTVSDRYGNTTAPEYRTFEYNLQGKISKINGLYGEPSYSYYINGNLAKIDFIFEDSYKTQNSYTYNMQKNPLSFVVDGFPDNPEYQNNNAYVSVMQTENSRMYYNATYKNIYLKDILIKQEINESNRGDVTISYEYTNCK